MSKSDIEEVKQIEEDCQIGSWSLQDYKDEIRRKDGLSFVVKEEGKIIGFILARLITTKDTTVHSKIENNQRSKKPQYLETKNLETEIEIYNIAVKQEFQNRGAGQKLINQILNSTVDLQSRSIWLEVRKSNTKTIKFYKKNDFIKISERRNFYNNPVEDGVVMKKLVKK